MAGLFIYDAQWMDKFTGWEEGGIIKFWAIYSVLELFSLLVLNLFLSRHGSEWLLENMDQILEFMEKQNVITKGSSFALLHYITFIKPLI